MENFLEKIEKYKEENVNHSPIWIWFEKILDREEASCLICKKIIQRKSGTTSAMIAHLKKLHGQLSKYNASKIYGLGSRTDFHIIFI